MEKWGPWAVRQFGYCCLLGCNQIQGLAMLPPKFKCCVAERLSVWYQCCVAERLSVWYLVSFSARK